MILAIFHLQVNLLLHCTCKFQLNLPCGLHDVKNRFSRWRLWRPSPISDQHDFSSFQSRSCPVATEQVLAQIDQRFGKRCQKLMETTLDFQSAYLYYFVSTRRPDAPHQVSTQFDHSL